MYPANHVQLDVKVPEREKKHHKSHQPIQLKFDTPTYAVKRVRSICMCDQGSTPALQNRAANMYALAQSLRQV